MHTPNSDLRAAVGHGFRECATRSRGICSGIAGKMATEEIDRAKVLRGNFLPRRPRLLTRRTRPRDLELMHVSSVILYRSEMYDEFPPSVKKLPCLAKESIYLSLLTTNDFHLLLALCPFVGASPTFFHTCTNTVGHLNSRSYIYMPCNQGCWLSGIITVQRIKLRPCIHFIHLRIQLTLSLFPSPFFFFLPLLTPENYSVISVIRSRLCYVR